ncbi:MATE family efflux transporter [Temperatibacter marinus]|uniref:Multidrug-efflux transporter n=1 Tax=Temperatibacter marinus TaxID=1456591 RepID=A0AA52EC16_9PROT|nr:MATE family efflux transporter [Temperatibacter marinus]WND01950.1 MATE family efflux transporter [Temperatibacter marinus]
MKSFPYQTVWKLAAPNIVSNMLAVSTMIAHMYIVAPLGADASAAVISATRVNFLLMAAAMALSVATTALVARAWGAEDYEEANKAATSSIGLSFIIALAIATPVFLFAEQIASIFSDDPSLIATTTTMMYPIACLCVIYAVNLTLSTNYRAIGNVLRPLKIMAVSSVSNIVMAYGFTMGAFGLPALGPLGIPVGACVAQVGITALYFIIWAQGKHEIKPNWDYLFCPIRFKKLAKIGIPSALEQYVIQIGSIIVMALLVSYGTEAFVAYGIGINILSVCIVIGIAFGSAGATLSGQRIGAGEPDQARQSGYVALKMALLCMTFLALVFGLFREPLSYLLTDDPAVAAHAQMFVVILALCQPLMAIEFAVGGTLRGAGDTRFPMMATLIGTIGARVILGYICVLNSWPLWIMYSLMLLDFIIKASALLWRLQGNIWLKSLDQTPPAPLQSAHAINRTGVREYYRIHCDEEEIKE